MSLKVALLLAVQGVEDPNGQNWNDDENTLQCVFLMGPGANPLGLVQFYHTYLLPSRSDNFEKFKT